MSEIDKNASIEYSPRAQTSEFPTTIARGDTEFRVTSFLRPKKIICVFPVTS